MEQVFRIVWTNEPLQWLILLVFAIAFLVEVYTVYQYWMIECKSPELAINYLTKNATSPSLSKYLDWNREHLAGIMESQSKAFQPQIREGRFVLLQYPAVLARSVPRSGLRFVPTLCTALGLLGTFYGIQKGLQGINPGINESQQLIDASKDLFAGMKTAFSNSLLGLGAGSLFTLVMFGCDWLRQQRRNSLREKLDAIAILQTPLQNLSRLDFSANQKAADALTEAAAIIAQQLNPQAIGQAVGQQIGQAFDRAIENRLAPAFQDIGETQKILQKINADQREILQNLIQNLRQELIEPIVDRLDQSANLTREASMAVNNLNAELGGISSSLANSILTIQQFQENTLKKLENFAESLQQILGNFQTDTQGVLQTVAEEIQRGVDQSIVGMEAQRAAFEQSAETAAANFQGIQEKLQAALRTQAKMQQQMLQVVQDQTVDILNRVNEAFQQQNNSLNTVGDRASGLMLDASNNLASSWHNIDEILHNTSQILQEELQQFRQVYQTSLQHFLNEQNNLLEATLGKQRQGLSEVVKNLENVFIEEAERRMALNQISNGGTQQ